MPLLQIYSQQQEKGLLAKQINEYIWENFISRAYLPQKKNTLGYSLKTELRSLEYDLAGKHL